MKKTRFASELMHSQVIIVGPRLAAEMLATSIGNRPIRKSRVRLYAEAMCRGLFLLTHQGIAFNTNGNLVDGHHRLQAICESGCEIKLMVTYGVEDISTQEFDTPLGRTVADRIERDSRIAHVLTLAAKIATGFGRPLTDDVLRVANTGLEGQISELLAHCGSNCKVIASAAMRLAAGMHMLLNPSQSGYVLRQYRALAEFDVEAMSPIAVAFLRQANVGKVLEGKQRTNTGKVRGGNQYDLLARGLKVFDPKLAKLSKIQVTDATRLEAIQMVREQLRKLMGMQ